MLQKVVGIILSFFVLYSCTVEDDLLLEESVFVRDPEIPSLPIYSEWGYNTFGVRYDRQSIVQDNSSYPLKVIVKDGVTSFIFDGRKYYNDDFKITFRINDFIPLDDVDLLNLNETIYDLSAGNIEVLIEDEGKKYMTEVISGELNFKKVQKLTLDDVDNGVVLSGVFHFKAVVDEVPVAFSKGRFDVIIGYSNFFALN